MPLTPFIGTDLTAAQKSGLAQDRYLDNRLLEMIKLEKADFPFHTLGKDYTIPANQGTKTVQFRRYLALSLFAGGHALVEGVPPTQPLLTEATTVSATVAQYGAFMKLSDVQEALHIDNIREIYQPELSRHAAELIERDVLRVIKAEASIYFAGNSTVDAMAEGLNKLTWQDLRRVALYMKNQLRSGNTKFGGKPVVVVHPNVMQDLLDDAAAMNHVFAAGQDNAPIKIGNLANYQLFGIYLQEAQIAPVVALHEVVGIDTKAEATDLTAGQIYFNSADSKYYKASGATAWAALTNQPGNVYVSFMIGKDPYVVTTLANGSVQFKMTGYEATKDDPLGQFSTVGYKLWTGAKVIDPFAIYAIHSFSGYDTVAITDYAGDMDASLAGTQTAVKRDVAKQTSDDNYTA